MSITELKTYLRFIAKVDASGGPDACHVWLAAKSGAGYGQLRISQKTIYAHRWIMGYLRGEPLATTEHVLHSCDNPPCVNPAHLRIGDRKQNMQDAMARGRMDTTGLALGRHLRHGEPTCPECRTAIAKYNRNQWADRK